MKQIPAISGQTFNLERDNAFVSGVYIIQLMEENTIVFTKKLTIADN
jgi:predicted polyphosphate/ATP-dependent NAD kinase